MKNGTFGRKMLAAVAIAVMSIAHCALAYGQETGILEPGSLRRAQNVAVNDAVQSNVTTGDDVEATNAALATNPPPKLVSANTKASPSRVRLLGASDSGKVKEYQYAATGDLRTTTSGRDITLYFNVTDNFIEIESASISLMAYDVDYPVATENDVTYFNGTPLGWRLQGGNDSWHANSNIPVSPWLINCPREAGGSEQNQFFVDVDSGNEGWVTCISEATLTIRGIVGIRVDASDGTESDGIKVEWTAVKDGATYTLYRAENSNMDGIKKIYSGKSLTYLDKAGKWFGGIKSGKVYFYQVEASTGEFGNDEGYYDAKIPEIESLEFPEFWLADTKESNKSKMPFKIKWNDFDEERYEVSELYIMLTGRADGQDFRLAKDKFPSAVAPNSEQLIDTVKLDGWKLPTGFGTYQVEVAVKVFDKVEGKELNDGYFMGPGNGKGSVNLFFDKYSKTGNKPNWYIYWPKEGAIGGGYIGDGGKFEYKSPRDNLAGNCIFTGNTVVQASNPIGYPSLLSWSCSSSYEIFDLAVQDGRTYDVNGQKIGSDSMGLEQLSAVIAHECRHGQLNSETYKGILLGDRKRKSNYQSVEDVIRSLETSGLVDHYKEYYDTIKNGVRCDLDGDCIIDEYEKAGTSTVNGDVVVAGGKYSNWNFRWDNPDTHSLRSLISSTYASYGDNEVLARYAESHPTVPLFVNTGVDWAFPGNNNHPEAMGDNENTWLNKRDGIVNSVFAAFSGGRSASSRSAKATANVKLLGGATQSDGIHDSGSVKSMPAFTDMSDGIISIGDIVADNTADSSTADGYSKLSLLLSVTNTGVAFPALIRGFLVDNSGIPIAWAETFEEEISSGTTNVSLEFPAAVIRSIKGSGYRLAAVEVYSYDGDMSTVRCVRTNVGDTSATYQNNQFVGNAANVLYNTFDETATSKSLDINVLVDVMEGGEYKLQGRLETTNGEFVATTSTSGWFDKGETVAKLSFAGEDIYLSGQDGPYVLQYISIEGDASKLDDRLSVYTTASYSHNDFAPSDAALAVDVSTFVRLNDEVGGDGSVDGLKFAFDVTNMTADMLVCRVKATLFGTNDLFVCSFDEQMPLTNGVNRVELFFVGNEVGGSGIVGPYYVRDVLLEPVSGATERFFPTMEPIDLTTDDFGAFPFEVNGELTFGEDANGDGYQLYVPIEIFRANTVTVTAMLVDANGKFVAMATASKKYTDSCTDSFTLTFSEQDMLASERKGPYTVRFVQIESDIPGIDPVRAKVPDTAKDVSSTYIRYVDCNAVGGNGYSWSTAFSTIQDAVDAADDGDVILVADGVYAPFDTRNKMIEIKSVNGYERTFVDGGGAVRCATLGFEESQTNSVLTGFTLLNGDASTSDVLVLWNCGGGVCCGTVRNCWIEECTASKGGGVYYGNLEGCVIKGNKATTYGGGSYYGKRVNCTIVGNTASYGGSGTYYGETFNSIVLDNTSYDEEDNYSGGVFVYSLTSPYVAGNGNVSGKAEFRDVSKWDYSLTRHSVCVNAGSADYVTQEFDIAGNRRIAGGVVDIGAYELKCSEYKAGFCDFVWDGIDAREGDVVKVSVFGGLDNNACSAQLYLTFNSAAVADVDLAKGKVDGVTPKGGLKFPLKISWVAGETGEKVVEIPVIADTAFEGEEFFTLQLADPVGMQLGEYRDCTVTIQDKNTKATLADGIGNQFLKPATSGAGKWYAVESWMADPAETERPMFVQSPDLIAGKTSTISFGSVKGAGDYYFDLKFIGEAGTGASYVDIYDGKSKLGTLRRSDNGDGWKSWHVSVSGTGNHNISIVFTQGADKDSRVRMTNVIWIPSSSSYYSVINISTSPEGAGVVSGAGTYANGTKVNFNATPRPGYTFVGWYRANGNLFGSKAKMSVKMTGSADFVALFRKDPYVRGLADPASAGKVTGSGPCATGKKVTLKATANKGYVFEGWYDERDLRLTQTASLMVDNSAKPAKTSATAYVVSNIVSDVTYYARFITVAEDKANISCTMGGLSFPNGDAPVINVTAPCGVYLNWPILTAGLSQTSAKVAGLPTGLKFNTKTGAIEGAPSAPSKIDAKTGKVVPSVVKITVTTAGKSTKVFQANLTITAIPDAVVGTFCGFVSPYDAEEKMFYRSQSPASFTLTTTSAGKITAKAVSPKGSVSFSANCWDEVDDGQYFVLMTARTGEMLLLYVESEPQYWNGSNHASGYLGGGSYGSGWQYVEAQRSSFLKFGKDYEHPEALSLAKSMQGTYKFNAAYKGNGEYELVQSTDKTATLSVAIKNTGAVTLSGTLPGTSYKVSGSGVLRVYPSIYEAEVFVCGASGKSINVMVILIATLDEDGKTVLTGSAYVNAVK